MNMGIKILENAYYAINLAVKSLQEKKGNKITRGATTDLLLYPQIINMAIIELTNFRSLTKKPFASIHL